MSQFIDVNHSKAHSKCCHFEAIKWRWRGMERYLMPLIVPHHHIVGDRCIYWVSLCCHVFNDWYVNAISMGKPTEFGKCCDAHSTSNHHVQRSVTFNQRRTYYGKLSKETFKSSRYWRHWMCVAWDSMIRWNCYLWCARQMWRDWETGTEKKRERNISISMCDDDSAMKYFPMLMMMTMINRLQTS